MQLKEEFRTYEALRREHDSQIVQIAMEGGLRIAPDQWSSLLYGDQSHKSHMQSIIDKVRIIRLFSIILYSQLPRHKLLISVIFESHAFIIKCSEIIQQIH